MDETTTDIICIKCKKDDSDSPNEIVLCDTCGIGKHLCMVAHVTPEPRPSGMLVCGEFSVIHSHEYASVPKGIRLHVVGGHLLHTIFVGLCTLV